jgi:hypothetical protein
MKTIKVLLLAANPSGTDQLELEKENRTIIEKVRASKFRDNIKIVSRWAVRPDDLIQYFNEETPDIVHFSGHGKRSAEIILTDEYGQAKPIPSDALTDLFSVLPGRIKVVLLNACWSRDQAEAISKRIDCTIGMRKSISDDAAILFSASFYRAIGFGKSVQNAFDQGCTSLALEGTREEKTPELIARARVNPSRLRLVRPRYRMWIVLLSAFALLALGIGGACSYLSHGEKIRQGNAFPRSEISFVDAVALRKQGLQAKNLPASQGRVLEHYVAWEGFVAELRPDGYVIQPEEVDPKDEIERALVVLRNPRERPEYRKGERIRILGFVTQFDATGTGVGNATIIEK